MTKLLQGEFSKRKMKLFLLRRYGNRFNFKKEILLKKWKLFLQRKIVIEIVREFPKAKILLPELPKKVRVGMIDFYMFM